MNILNNGRFGMAAALSGTMKAVLKKAVSWLLFLFGKSLIFCKWETCNMYSKQWNCRET